MQESGSKEKRFSVTYFDGINTTVQSSLAKRTEMSHAENARMSKIGSLDKREGQTVKGTTSSGSRFVAVKNHGLVNFDTTKTTQQGIFRISEAASDPQTFSVNIYDSITVTDDLLEGDYDTDFTVTTDDTTFQAFVVDYVTITEPSFVSRSDSTTKKVTNSSELVDMYYLSTTDTWTKMSDSDALNMIGGQFDFANVDEDLVFVNQNDKNRMLSSNGVTVISSSDAGSLYNSPDASRVCFYKNRIYLADFVRENIRYQNMIIRSSYKLGIIALVDGDHDSGSTSISVTDTKYFYSNSGMNTYDIYRGSTFLETVTVSSVGETTITTGAVSNELNSSDEIWIHGTYDGEKQFRWINNPTSTGRDVKQYDTFFLSGGKNDPVTLFDTIGSVLLIGNSNTLASWDDYTLKNFDLNIGCSSKNGSVKLLGTLYFIHNSGIYATTGGVPTLISRKIERYINGATKSGIESSAAGYKGLSVFFTIGDSTIYNEDGSVEKILKDVCLEYNVADQNWYIHTNVPITEFEHFIAADGTKYLLGAHDGNSKSIVSFLNGNTDDGDEIFLRVDTQELQFTQEFEMYSNPIAVVIETQRGTQMKCFISVDKSDFYELKGTIKKGVSILKINSEDEAKTKPTVCRKIKLSFRDSSKQLCRLTQFAVIYLPTTMSEPTE